MWKGTIFELRGKRYKIQKINKEGVYASKMLDEYKCQKGRPSRFPHIDVAASLKIAVEKFFETPKPPKPRAPRTVKWAEREEKEAREKAEEEVEEIEKEPEVILTPEEKKAKEEEEKASEERKAAVLQKLFNLLSDSSTTDDW